MNFMYGKEVGEMLLLNKINNIYVEFADIVDLAHKNDLEYAATESLLSIPAKKLMYNRLVLLYNDYIE